MEFIKFLYNVKTIIVYRYAVSKPVSVVVCRLASRFTLDDKRYGHRQTIDESRNKEEGAKQTLERIRSTPLGQNTCSSVPSGSTYSGCKLESPGTGEQRPFQLHQEIGVEVHASESMCESRLTIPVGSPQPRWEAETPAKDSGTIRHLN